MAHGGGCEKQKFSNYPSFFARSLGEVSLPVCFGARSSLERDFEGHDRRNRAREEKGTRRAEKGKTRLDKFETRSKQVFVEKCLRFDQID